MTQKSTINCKSRLQAILAMLVILLAATTVGCSDHDEPTPPPAGQDENPTKDWGDETPFFLIDSVESISFVNKNSDGFLLNSKENNCDYFVLKYDWAFAPQRNSEPNMKGNIYITFYVAFNGTHVSPVENVDRYNKMCKKMGAKPLCSLNDSTELGSLPFYTLRYNHTMETIANMEGLADRNPLTGELYANGKEFTAHIGFRPQASKSYIEKYLNTLVPDPTNNPEGISPYFRSIDTFLKMPQFLTWVDEKLECAMIMPNEPGIYDVTIRITLANGKVLEDNAKIKFMPEGTEYPQ